MTGKSRKIRMQRVNLLLLVMAGLLLVVSGNASQSQPGGQLNATPRLLKTPVVKDSIDQKTGLIIAPGFNIVSTTCIRCHSPKLITEKRATREGWVATIRWMQKTQGLWDLGKDEPVILDYLTKNYAPQNEGRRPNLKVAEWYKLEN